MCRRERADEKGKIDVVKVAELLIKVFFFHRTVVRVKTFRKDN